MSSGDKEDRGALLTAPWFLAALALWAINDHVLKAQFHNAVTGKLSDVACLVAIPVLMASAYEMLTPRPTRRTAERVLVASAVISALIMALINTVPVAAETYQVVMGIARYPLDVALALMAGHSASGLGEARLWMDASDLVTLPAALIPIWFSRRRDDRSFFLQPRMTKS